MVATEKNKAGPGVVGLAPVLEGGNEKVDVHRECLRPLSAAQLLHSCSSYHEIGLNGWKSTLQRGCERACVLDVAYLATMN